MPPEVRPHLVALYAFARSADDFADEPEYEGRRVEALDRWEEALHRCCHGEADHPVFVALADTIEKRDLPIPPLEDMLSAFRMDLDVQRYATIAALRGYTSRSAEPVGRLLLALFGYRDAELVRYADEMSTALAAHQLLAGRRRRRRPRSHLHPRRGPALLRRHRGRHQGAQARARRCAI